MAKQFTQNLLFKIEELQNRLEESEQLIEAIKAGEVDAFYIIGGRHSSNSRKLLAVCQEQCPKSFLIETEEEINSQDLIGAETVGVTAGASTPNWLIEKVVKHLEEIGERQKNELPLN